MWYHKLTSKVHLVPPPIIQGIKHISIDLFLDDQKLNLERNISCGMIESYYLVACIFFQTIMMDFKTSDET